MHHGIAHLDAGGITVGQNPSCALLKKGSRPTKLSGYEGAAALDVTLMCFAY